MAILSLPWFADLLRDVDPSLRPILVLAGLLIAVGLGESIGSAGGRPLARSLGTGVLSAADRVGGSLVGVAQALLIIWLLGSLLAIGPLPRLTEVAQSVGRRSGRSRPSSRPSPKSPASSAACSTHSGLPDVFVGFEPLPGPRSRRGRTTRSRGGSPRPPRRARSRSRPGPAASARSGPGSSSPTGTSSPTPTSSPARTRTAIRVADSDGRTWDAVPVLFDPNLDIALLRAGRLDLPALRFANRDPSRGAIAATLGYPGGGALTILPAAVTGEYTATGLDIYGEDRVRRDILELRAAIERGDSGGPLILEDGTVGGVVFAESRTNDSRGLRPVADGGRDRDRARDRPDERGRDRSLPALSPGSYT